LELSAQDELCVNSEKKKFGSSLKYHPELAVHMDNVTARSGKQQSRDTLSNVDMKIKKGNLSVVLGPVGCGKVKITLFN
jgi:ABC-type transporter Mla maintaining outer membrane lipid asymmetry ATPase subunit MlaF